MSAGLSDRAQGHEALTAFYTRLFELLPDYSGGFDGQVTTRDTTVVWGRFSGTISSPVLGSRAMGRRIDVPVTFLRTVRDGLVYRDMGYLDAATVYRQTGLSVPSLDAYPRAASFVDRFAAHWAEPKPEDFRDLMPPDTSNYYPGMTEPQGPEGVLAWLISALQAFPDIALRIARWAVDQDAVLIELEGSATVNGRQLRWGAADRFTLIGDRCVEGRSYFDTRPLMEALQPTASSAQEGSTQPPRALDEARADEPAVPVGPGPLGAGTVRHRGAGGQWLEGDLVRRHRPTDERQPRGLRGRSNAGSSARLRTDGTASTAAVPSTPSAADR
jgi:predicted ester cyclase